jgi:hypothetical protein
MAVWGIQPVEFMNAMHSAWCRGQQNYTAASAEAAENRSGNPCILVVYHNWNSLGCSLRAACLLFQPMPLVKLVRHLMCGVTFHFTRQLQDHYSQAVAAQRRLSRRQFFPAQSHPLSA